MKLHLCLIAGLSLVSAVSAQNFEKNAQQFSAKAGKSGATSKDGILLKLEEGACWRAAGKLEQSNQAFELAEERINHYDDQAKVKVSKEAVAMITNLSMLPYEGYAYDKIMMNTYKALNYLQAGDYEKTRVEFNRALERQRDAVELNAARLEKAQGQSKADAKAQDDEKLKGQFKDKYSELDSMKAYAVYVNPLTVYLDGLFFMAQSTGSSDYERSRKSFERVQSMIGDNPYVPQDLAAIAQAQAGQPLPPTTWVIFETGQAPLRKEVRIDIPIGRAFGSGVPYAGAAFPKLDFRGQEVSSLTINANGTNQTTVLLSNMDSVIAQDFKNELPLVTTKTIAASAAKAGATYGLSQGAGIFGKVAGVALQAAFNKADLRTWTTLPKEFYLCRIATPADRKLELTAPDSGERTSVTVADGNLNLIWVKSVRERTPLVITQCKLK